MDQKQALAEKLAELEIKIRETRTDARPFSETADHDGDF